MENILICGFRHQAGQLCFYIENGGCGSVAAFVADREYQTVRELCGRPVVCFEEAMERYSPQTHKMAVSFAYQHMIHDRAEKSLKSRIPAFYFCQQIRRGICEKHWRGSNCLSRLQHLLWR